MKLFVINMKSAGLRRERMQSLLSAQGVDFEFFDAIKGADLSEDEILKKGLANNLGLTRAEVGVLLSHVAIWQKMVDEQIKVAVILEDDIHLAPSFKKVINEINIPDDALGLFRLETVLASVDVTLKPVQKVGNIKIHQIFSNHAATAGYMLNMKTAQHLLTQVPKMRLALDNELFDPVRRNIQGVDVFQCVPGVVIQDAAVMKSVNALDQQIDFLKSTLGDARVDHSFGYVEPKKVTLLNRLKNLLRPVYLLFYSLALLPKKRKRVRVKYEVSDLN